MWAISASVGPLAAPRAVPASAKAAAPVAAASRRAFFIVASPLRCCRVSALAHPIGCDLRGKVPELSIRHALTLAAAAMLAVAAPAAAELKRPELMMIQTIDSEQERTVAMLAKWVNQNSGTMNFAGVKAVGDMVRAELEPLGFKVEWIDMSAAKRAGHLVARHVPQSRGNGRGKRLLLIGHLDTV